MKKPPKINLSKTYQSFESQLVKLGGLPLSPHRSPDEALGELFAQVQLGQVYGDGKTFVDLVPARRIKRILEEYELRRRLPEFNLPEFVRRHFYSFGEEAEGGYVSNPNSTPVEHIRELWHVLERRTTHQKGSLLALPYAYITPGGRFREQFYWDSYFIMLGLAADRNIGMIEGMMKNCTHMIRKFGFIPTANRSYFLSRSQPPFFSHMVELLSQHKGRSVLVGYLPYLLSEHRFWMKSDFTFRLGALPETRRVVRLPDKSVLNRYFDDKRTPRPESYKEDVGTLGASTKQTNQIYLDLRAAAESGWDFSSRWFRDPADISTIYTTDIVPVDLNCLLYHLELLIAESYRVLHQPLFMRQFEKQANARKAAITRYCWSESKHFFYDYDYVRGRRSPALTLAGVFPLFVGLASPAQAKAVAATLEKQFLKPGGLQTTVLDTGQQWDAPNGWAPLQWVVIKGLRNYGFDDLANDIKKRWLGTNLQVYKREYKMIEKYNVIKSSVLGGGGEYPLQDGFGWTNGVLQALLSE